MRRFDSPYGSLVLTNERILHIYSFHLDVRGCIRYFALTLKEPEQTASSVHDPSVVVCYRYLPKRKKYLAIVIHIQKKFILTAYLAKKPKGDIL